MVMPPNLPFALNRLIKQIEKHALAGPRRTGQQHAPRCLQVRQLLLRRNDTRELKRILVFRFGLDRPPAEALILLNRKSMDWERRQKVRRWGVVVELSMESSELDDGPSLVVIPCDGSLVNERAVGFKEVDGRFGRRGRGG